MKKKILIARVAMTMVFAAAGMSAWADEVTAEQALEQAQQFVSSHNKRKSAPTVKSAGQVSGLYMFNVSSGGFVIVSNDDQTVPILGFGESGSIDPDDLPDNMRAWLQGYAEQIAWLQNNGNSGDDVNNRSRAPRRAAMTAIAPLVKTNWNQSRPYNDLCPTIDGTRTVTGCVATTVAQLMNYHQWPETACTAIDGYTTSTLDKNRNSYELTVSGLDATTFDWDTGTTEQQQAVATLMRYCGTALQMIYGLSANGGSSAYSEAIPYALKHCFGYDGGIQHCYRKNYSYTAWVDLIYSELAAKRPVALGGQSTGGGHSFICDGYKYDNADYFHINWGWAGSSDGYFLLSALNPYEQGIGGSSSLDGFSFGQDAVIGIRRPVDGNADYCLSLEGLRLGSPNGAAASKTYVRDGETGTFTGISLYYDVWNYNYGSNAYDVTVQLVDGSGNVVQTLGGQGNKMMAWTEHISTTLTDLSIDGTVADGTYYIKVKSRPTGSSDWQECFDGDAYKLTATISGNNLTIGVPIPANVTPATVSFAVTGESSTGSEQTVTATVTGGRGDYSGNLVLCVNGSAVMGQIAHIPAGEEVVLKFSYIPSYVGDNTLTLWTHLISGTRITGSGTVSIGTLIIDNNGSNNTGLIGKNNGSTTNVKLAGRTLYKDGSWNTLVLPFPMTAEQVSAQLAPAALMTLKSSAFAGGELTLTFEDATTIEAGKPYIIKWDATTPDYIENPEFTGVTISNATSNVPTSYADFIGTYSPIVWESENNSVLFLGSGNTLYFPQPSGSEKPHVNAFRGYFQLKGLTASEVSLARMNFDEQGTQTIIGHTEITEITERADAAWYSLDGVKLDSKPSSKGIYIHGNKKVVVE